MRLLLVEDNDRLAELVVKGLVDAGFTLDRVDGKNRRRMTLHLSLWAGRRAPRSSRPPTAASTI